MKPLSPKQQEIRAREGSILDVGQTMLLERGYVGITMDRVAAAVGVSKGTIYQHFSNKEDLLAAVAIRVGDIRGALFERAASFRGRSRERMTAVGIAVELFTGLYPEYEQAGRMVKSQSIQAKVSENRRARLESCSMRCFGVAVGIARDAVANGDLALDAGRTVEQLCVGLWHLYMGGMMSRDLTDCLPPGMPLEMTELLHANAQVLLDGFGWRPLSGALDLPALRERILAGVFPAEARRLGLPLGLHR